MYVIHFENLKIQVRIELKLKIIKRVLAFNQSQWLQPYIKFNTQKRIAAEKNNDKDGKTLHKLMNKIIYRKKWKT